MAWNILKTGLLLPGELFLFDNVWCLKGVDSYVMHHLYLTKDVSFLKMGRCDSDVMFLNVSLGWSEKKGRNVVFLHLLFDVEVSFPLRCVYGDESTGIPFIPTRISVIFDVPAKLLHSRIFRSWIRLEYIQNFHFCLDFEETVWRWAGLANRLFPSVELSMWTMEWVCGIKKSLFIKF